MSGCHFWIAVSHHCLPEAQSSGEWLVKRGLEKDLTWPHTPDLCSTCSGTTPNTNMEMEKNHKALYREIITLPALPWVLAFSSSSGCNSMGEEAGKQENTHVPSARQPWVPQGGTPLITCPIYSPPWLQLSPLHPYKSHHHHATELDFNLCQQQVGRALPLFGFPGHS